MHIGSATKAQKNWLPKLFFSLSSHNHYTFQNSLSPRNIDIETTLCQKKYSNNTIQGLSWGHNTTKQKKNRE
jgi:hypothetical protein